MKTNFTEAQLQQIAGLFKNKFGSRKIANIIGCSRSTIRRAYQQLGLNSASVKCPKTSYLVVDKTCKKCKLIKSVDYFAPRMSRGYLSYDAYCRLCRSGIKQKVNKEWQREYLKKNKEKLSVYNKSYQKNCRKKRQYNSKYQITYLKKKMHENPAFKLRGIISCSINNALRKSNSSKNNQSCLTHLEYTIDELKSHIESLFEPWMSWQNHGKYIASKWDDNDSSTWKWQIDHIMPHSTFEYVSMEDDGFKKCWQLSNLRPLSAKQNLLDGVTKKRHNLI